MRGGSSPFLERCWVEGWGVHTFRKSHGVEKRANGRRDGRAECQHTNFVGKFMECVACYRRIEVLQWGKGATAGGREGARVRLFLAQELP